MFARFMVGWCFFAAVLSVVAIARHIIVGNLWWSSAWGVCLAFYVFLTLYWLREVEGRG